jgi:hypothetical protein
VGRSHAHRTVLWNAVPAHTFVTPVACLAVTGTCTASTCDCMNFITQATLIYIGATPYSAYGSQMPRTSNDIKGMLAPAFKTMMDQGKILTRVDEVGGPHWPESQSFSLHHFLGHTRLERCTRWSRSYTAGALHSVE